MHLILGGKYQGKLDYAKKLYGSFPAVCDLEHDSIITSGLILNVHLGVRRLLAENKYAYEFFTSNLEVLRPSVIICDEICGGVVPSDAFERFWRDETGKIYQLLAHEAEIVDRIFAGLALRLKG